MSIRLTRSSIRAYWNKINGDTRLNAILDPDEDWARANGRAILMAAAGISEQTHEALKARYGSRLNAILETDPFRLYAESDAISFAAAAYIYNHGETRNPDSLARAAVYAAIHQTADVGNVHFDRRLILDRAQSLSGAPHPQIDAAWRRAAANGEIVEFDHNHTRHGVLNRHLEEERFIASRIISAAEPVPFPASWAEIEAALIASGCPAPDTSQTAAVMNALTNRVAFVTGGPGTGKTTILTAIARLYGERHPDAPIMCVSLAARIARAIHARTGLPADTIHNYLEYRDGAFLRNAANPLDVELLFVEEAFMIDNKLFAALLKALPLNTRIILIGDPGQLEPIGRGRPIHSLLASGRIPNHTLTTNHRSGPGSTIPLSGNRVLRGLNPLAGPDLVHISTLSTPDTLRNVVAIHRKIKELRGDEEVQIITAMQGGHCGAKAINDAITGRPGYAKGDRVIQLKNNRESDFYNGELGRIVDIGAKGLTVVTDGGTVVEYASLTPRQLAKAYCITIHKSQGLEYPDVIAVFHPNARRMMTRTLINVAITRARQRCTLIDQQNQIVLALTRPAASPRATLLPSILAGRNAV